MYPFERQLVRDHKTQGDIGSIGGRPGSGLAFDGEGQPAGFKLIPHQLVLLSRRAGIPMRPAIAPVMEPDAAAREAGPLGAIARRLFTLMVRLSEAMP